MDIFSIYFYIYHYLVFCGKQFRFRITSKFIFILHVTTDLKHKVTITRLTITVSLLVPLYQQLHEHPKYLCFSLTVGPKNILLKERTLRQNICLISNYISFYRNLSFSL